MQLGEELLATGDITNGVEHLSLAVAVCGQPHSLLSVLQQTLPPQIYHLLLQNLEVGQSLSIESSYIIYLAQCFSYNNRVTRYRYTISVVSEQMLDCVGGMHEIFTSLLIYYITKSDKLQRSRYLNPNFSKNGFERFRFRNHPDRLLLFTVGNGQ